MPSEVIRICVLGDPGVGKSSLTLQFTQAQFPVDFDPNIEDIYKKDLTIKGKQYQLHILDTAQQDDYSHLKEVQLQQADGFVLVYKVTSIQSMGSATNGYRHIMRIHGEIPPCILIGNQIDLEYERLVTPAEGKEIVEELELSEYFETSAKNDCNVNNAFHYLAEKIVEKREEAAKLKRVSQEAKMRQAVSKPQKPILIKTDISNETLITTTNKVGTSSEVTSTTNFNRRQTFTTLNQKESVDVLETSSRPSDGGTPVKQRSHQSTRPLVDEKKDKGNTCCIIM